MKYAHAAVVGMLHGLLCTPSLVLACSGDTSMSGGNLGVTSSEYHNSMDCHWAGSCDSGHPTIHFSSFQTESSYDYLRIYDGSSDSSPRVGSFSGSSDPSDMTMSSSQIYITWHTDGSVTSGGFQAHVSCSGGSSGGSCSGAMDIPSSGDIRVNGYGNNQDCNWGGGCSSGHPYIHFTSFDTENNFDQVSVYDGSSDSSPQLASLSGSSTPSDVQTTGSHIYVSFHTDGSVTHSGFSAHIGCHSSSSSGSSSSGNTCSGSMPIPSGGDIAVDSYGNHQDCDWGGHCDNGHPYIHFTSMDTESSYDTVSVYDGDSDSAPRLGRFSGSSVPSDQEATGHSIFVKFTTDGSVVHSGFHAHLGCHGSSSSSTSHSSSSANAQALTVGHTVNGNINSAQEQQWYSFSATHGRSYEITLTPGSVQDTFMTLVDRDGTTTLAQNDDHNGYGSYIEWECPSSGTYFVMARGYGSHTGSFTLEVAESTSCGGRGSGDSLTGEGSITHTSYADGESCAWVIQCSGSQHPMLTVTSLGTESCCDHVDIYDGSWTTRMGHLSGSLASQSQTEFHATGNQLAVEFTSDGSITGNGFVAEYNCNSPPPPPPDPCEGFQCNAPHGSCHARAEGTAACQCDTGYSGPHCDIHDPCEGVTCDDHGTCFAGSCDCFAGYSGSSCQTWTFNADEPSSICEVHQRAMTLTAAHGIIADDRPGLSTDTHGYSNDLSCEARIHAGADETVLLQFTHINIEDPDTAACAGHTGDFVTVHDGADATAPVLGQFTGTALPPAVRSTGADMYITFSTDPDNTCIGDPNKKPGFLADWTFIDPCRFDHSECDEPHPAILCLNATNGQRECVPASLPTAPWQTPWAAAGRATTPADELPTIRDVCASGLVAIKERTARWLQQASDYQLQAAEGNAGVIATQICLERRFDSLECFKEESGEERQALADLHQAACGFAKLRGRGDSLLGVLSSPDVRPLTFDEYRDTLESVLDYLDNLNTQQLSLYSRRDLQAELARQAGLSTRSALDERQLWSQKAADDQARMDVYKSQVQEIGDRIAALLQQMNLEGPQLIQSALDQIQSRRADFQQAINQAAMRQEEQDALRQQLRQLQQQQVQLQAQRDAIDDDHTPQIEAAEHRLQANQQQQQRAQLRLRDAEQQQAQGGAPPPTSGSCGAQCAGRVQPSSNGCGTDFTGAYHSWAMNVMEWATGCYSIPYIMNDMEPCCDQHDICYGTCGMTQEFCDSQLRDCMEAQATLPDCQTCIDVSSLLVEIAGCDHFTAAQDESVARSCQNHDSAQGCRPSVLSSPDRALETAGEVCNAVAGVAGAIAATHIPVVSQAAEAVEVVAEVASYGVSVVEDAWDTVSSWFGRRMQDCGDLDAAECTQMQSRIQQMQAQLDASRRLVHTMAALSELNSAIVTPAEIDPVELARVDMSFLDADLLSDQVVASQMSDALGAASGSFTVEMNELATLVHSKLEQLKSFYTAAISKRSNEQQRDLMTQRAARAAALVSAEQDTAAQQQIAIDFFDAKMRAYSHIGLQYIVEEVRAYEYEFLVDYPDIQSVLGQLQAAPLAGSEYYTVLSQAQTDLRQAITRQMSTVNHRPQHCVSAIEYNVADIQNEFDTFARTGQLTVAIDMPASTSYFGVTFDEINVYFMGMTGRRYTSAGEQSSTVTVSAVKSGTSTFLDAHGKKRRFTHESTNPPLEFNYNADNCASLSEADPRLSDSDAFIKYSPYGTWTITLNDFTAYDLSRITSVRIEFDLAYSRGSFGGSSVFFTNQMGCTAPLADTGCSELGALPRCEDFNDLNMLLAPLETVCCSDPANCPNGVPIDCPSFECGQQLNLVQDACSAYFEEYTTVTGAVSTAIASTIETCRAYAIPSSCRDFSEFQEFVHPVADVCCGGATVDECIATMPTACDSACAERLLPMYGACEPFLAAGGAATSQLKTFFDSAAMLCNGGTMPEVGGSPPQLPAEDCVDDAAGMVASSGASCEMIAALGCDTDLHALSAAAPPGISVADVCPATCHACTSPTGGAEQSEEDCFDSFMAISSDLESACCAIGECAETGAPSRCSASCGAALRPFSEACGEWAQQDEAFTDIRGLLDLCADQTSAAQANAVCLQSLGTISDDVTTSCCADAASCAEGYPTTCTEDCAAVLEPFFEGCSDWVKQSTDFAVLAPMIGMCEDTVYGAYTGSMFSHRCARAESHRYIQATLPEACCGTHQELCPTGIPPLPGTCTATCAPAFEEFYAECHPSFSDTDAVAYGQFLTLCQNQNAWSGH